MTLSCKFMACRCSFTSFTIVNWVMYENVPTLIDQLFAKSSEVWHIEIYYWITRKIPSQYVWATMGLWAYHISSSVLSLSPHFLVVLRFHSVQECSVYSKVRLKMRTSFNLHKFLWNHFPFRRVNDLWYPICLIGVLVRSPSFKLNYLRYFEFVPPWPESISNFVSISFPWSSGTPRLRVNLAFPSPNWVE